MSIEIRHGRSSLAPFIRRVQGVYESGGSLTDARSQIPEYLADQRRLVGDRYQDTSRLLRPIHMLVDVAILNALVVYEHYRSNDDRLPDSLASSFILGALCPSPSILITVDDNIFKYHPSELVKQDGRVASPCFSP